MKKMIYYNLLLLSVLIVGCTDDIDKLKNAMNITIATPEVKSHVHLEFVDAKTGKYISEDQVTVKLSGKDADKFYDSLGDQKQTFTSVMGMVDFIVNPKLNLDNLKDSPLEFNVTAQSDKYVEYLERIYINESKNVLKRVYMVNKSDLPQGVSREAKSLFVSTKDGKVQSTAVAQLDGGHSTVEITQGTVLKDASGNIVNGNVKSDILFYNPSHEGAMQSFPGGFDTKAILPDGSTGNISFMSAGLFDINLSVGNTAVKTFEGGSVKLTTKLDPGLMNPNTQSPIAEGDEIDMWSLDAAALIWKYEKTIKVKKINGELYFQETINHLSCWNWDWHGVGCYIGPKIQWVGPSVIGSVTIKNRHPVTYYSEQMQTLINTDDPYYNNMQFYNVPGFPATIDFVSDDADLKFQPQTLSIANMCDQRTYTVNVSYSGNIKIYNVNLDMTAQSASKSNRKVKANVFFYMRPVNGYYYSYVEMINGMLKTSIKANTEYYIWGYLGTSYGEGKLKVEDIGTQLKVTLTPVYYFNYYNYTGVHQIGQEHVRVETINKPAQGNTINLKTTIIMPDAVFNKLGL